MNFEPAEDGLVGISISGTQLRMAEVVDRVAKKHISRVASGQLKASFTSESISKRENIASLANSINNLYDANGFESSKASFSLNSQNVLIRKIPIDFPLDDANLKEHVMWEASQVLISPPNDYIIDYDVQSESSENENVVILVAVRKSIVNYLKEVFAATKLQLQGIDVDVFAAQRVVENTYDLSYDSKVSLVDLHPSKIQISVLHNGFFLEQEIAYNSDLPKDKAEKTEFLSRIISKEMRRIILDNKLGKSVDDMEEIFIYGDNVDESIIEALVKAHDVNLHRVNPFDKITLETTPVDPDVTKHPEAYVASVGTAIKGL
ncbi:MAG: pilus assembly protein PilM [Deferribacteres bacterium]|nr:pilus assembly protein PilM [candidate division KSB1 bacterium]MCB9502938.1 pilus assembly protein PilM [Deferribacteres bacterium]